MVKENSEPIPYSLSTYIFSWNISDSFVNSSTTLFGADNWSNYTANVTATKNIALLCEKYKARLIYISTDLVYAGYRGSFLKEDSKLIPASLYAETKLVGEMKVKESTDNYLILKTALLYGFGLNHSRCHFHFMYDELKKNRPVKLFTDQFRTPISLKDAANIITDLAEMDIVGETINLGGLEIYVLF
jgi:dTDP-4-dehydrorhamnose reductase